MNEVKKIIVNGREYDGVEQMPPEAREEYWRAIAAMRESGISNMPDFVKKDTVSRSVVQESFVYNGREYKSRDALPPEARALLDPMPKTPVSDKTTKVEIKTFQTFSPKINHIENFKNMSGGLDESSKKTPAIAWLLVKILVVLVVILLFLLFLSSIRTKG